MMTLSTAQQAPLESPVSAVSWGAIAAGTLAATTASLVLVVLGSGLGLAILSPWAGAGASATTFVISAAIWMIVVQWLSSGLGGYVAGRLRTQWSGVHDDEVYFRDTAHGFLAWAFSTLFIAVVFGATLGSAISGAGSAAVSTANGVAQSGAANTLMSTDYAVDLLFRPAQTTLGSTLGNAPDSPATIAQSKAEAGRILVNSLVSGQMTGPDKIYLGRLVAAATGMSDADAQNRIGDILAQFDQAKVKAKQVADAARKSALTTALMTALALVIGAFIASAAGALGGMRRDDYVALTRTSL